MSTATSTEPTAMATNVTWVDAFGASRIASFGTRESAERFRVEVANTAGTAHIRIYTVAREV